MADIARLGLQIDSSQAVTGKRNLDDFARGASNAEQAVNRFERQTGAATRQQAAMTAGIRGTRAELSMILPYITRLSAALAAPFAVASIINTTREFEKLRATLSTLEGGAAQGRDAFREIQQFAAETPYDVQQVTEAYIRLRSLGLDPTTDSLRSYGNTASAMGKNILQLVEAVADASTGENERLKEFGIRATDLGNRVAFTFQGVTTVVAKNADEIQKYLIKIGNTQFAGAMTNQMNTLNGVFSNFQDTLSNLQNEIGMGFAEEMKGSTRSMTEFLQMLIDNGDAAAIGRDIASMMRTLGSAASETADLIRDLDASQFGEFLREFEKFSGLSRVVKVQRPQDVGADFKSLMDPIGEYNKIKVPEEKANPDPSQQSGTGGTFGRDKLDQYERMTARIEARAAALHTETAAMNLTTFAATQLTTQRDLERAAIQAGLELTPQLLEQITQTASKYAEATLFAEGMRLEMENLTPFEAMKQELAQLNEMLAHGAISWETYAQATLKTKATAHLAMANMAKDATGLLGQIFENSKAVAIADAIISTYQGVAKSLSAYPMPFAAVMAAGHLALGLKQVAAIRSTNKNSKSTPGTVGGGGASAGAVAPPVETPSGKTMAVTLHGDRFDRESVEDLFERFNEHLGDGGRIVLNNAGGA